LIAIITSDPIESRSIIPYGNLITELRQEIAESGQTHQVSEKKNLSEGIGCVIWFPGFSIEQML
jgi:hypothetical protein